MCWVSIVFRVEQRTSVLQRREGCLHNNDDDGVDNDDDDDDDDDDEDDDDNDDDDDADDFLPTARCMKLSWFEVEYATKDKVLTLSPWPLPLLPSPKIRVPYNN